MGWRKELHKLPQTAKEEGGKTTKTITTKGWWAAWLIRMDLLKGYSTAAGLCCGMGVVHGSSIGASWHKFWNGPGKGHSYRYTSSSDTLWGTLANLQWAVRYSCKFTVSREVLLQIYSEQRGTLANLRGVELAATLCMLLVFSKWRLKCYLFLTKWFDQK